MLSQHGIIELLQLRMNSYVLESLLKSSNQSFTNSPQTDVGSRFFFYAAMTRTVKNLDLSGSPIDG